MSLANSLSQSVQTKEIKKPEKIMCPMVSAQRCKRTQGTPEGKIKALSIKTKVCRGRSRENGNCDCHPPEPCAGVVARGLGNRSRVRWCRMARWKIRSACECLGRRRVGEATMQVRCCLNRPVALAWLWRGWCPRALGCFLSEERRGVGRGLLLKPSNPGVDFGSCCAAGTSHGY